MAEPTATHVKLASGRWHRLSLAEQLGNVGSEVGRTIRAKAQGNDERMWSALERALELIDLTSADHRHVHRRKEIRRAREVLCDFVVGDNAYHSSAESLEAYFMQFALAARLHR